MSKQPQILITDDEKSIRNILRDILEYESYKVEEAENGVDAVKTVSEKEIDLVILDIKMKGMDGIETLEKIKETKPDLPVIMISGHGTIKIAVDATKKGAFDFLEKPPDLNRLLVTVRNALKSSELERENKQIRSELHGASEIIGESAPIQKIKDTITKIAATSSRVLITGENGTGKELVARSIHSQSRRASKPFVDVNCAAIPAELLESELFGHEKGAFTSAVKQRIGKFEQANEGTLFLDEVGDMSLSAQAKVLRALQENKVQRVGSDKDIKVDVRVIAATNKDLKNEIQLGNFREDLFHRISVFEIHVEPLNNRISDIPLLIKYFSEKISNNYNIKTLEIDENDSYILNHNPNRNVAILTIHIFVVERTTPTTCTGTGYPPLSYVAIIREPRSFNNTSNFLCRLNSWNEEIANARIQYLSNQ